MRKKILLPLITALILSLTACGTPAAGNSGAKGGGLPGTAGTEMVTLNVTSEPIDLNPMRLSDTISQSVLYHCMSGLTRLDGNDQPIADLAEHWDISEDKTVYTMYLRQDAKWTNGDAVTAHDFYYSWVTQMTPATGTIYAAYLYQNIKNGQAFYQGEVDASQLGLRVVDDYTLEITWSHPMANGLFYLSQPFFLPMNQRAYEEIGDQAYAKEADKMVTNGAYRIKEWIHDSQILLEKVDDYYDADSIRIPQVKLAMVSDMNTNLNAFMAAELDMCSLFSEQISQVEAVDPSAVHSYIDGGSWYLNFNTKDPFLSNVNLRKALAYSIDVQSLLDYVINDGSIAADGLVPGIIAGVGEESYTQARGSLFQYDKTAAQSYLAQALKELSIEAGQLRLTFSCTDTTYNQNQAAYLQQQWKENLGLDVELRSMSAKALSEAKYSGDYTFCVDGWGPSENDAITFLENFQSGNTNNHGSYYNTQYDALIQGSLQEPDAQKRQDMLMEAERLLIDDAAVGPLYFTCSVYGVSHKLEGLVRTPFQFFNVRDAYIQR